MSSVQRFTFGQMFLWDGIGLCLLPLSSLRFRRSRLAVAQHRGKGQSAGDQVAAGPAYEG